MGKKQNPKPRRLAQFGLIIAFLGYALILCSTLNDARPLAWKLRYGYSFLIPALVCNYVATYNLTPGRLKTVITYIGHIAMLIFACFALSTIAHK